MKDRFEKIQQVVSDIDGTLLTAGNALHPRTQAVIHALRKKKQCELTVSTGRSFPLSNPLVQHLGLSAPFIFSGGAIYDQKTKAVLTDHFIDAETVKSIQYFARERKLGLVAHTTECMLCLMDDADWAKIAEIEWIKGEKVNHAMRVDSVETKAGESVIRLDIFSEDQPLTAANIQVTHKFPQLHAVQMTRSIELTPVGVNKGSALKMLALMQDLKLDQIMAIGDSLNDMALLQEAGIGVAMETAPDDLKDVADVIVPSSDQGGFADALELLLYFIPN